MKCLNYKRNHWTKIDRKNAFTQSSTVREANWTTLVMTQVEKVQTGQACAFEVMKPCICWRQPYLLPSSSSVEEILSQYEKEGQMLCNNVKTKPSEQFYSPLHLWRWEGKQSLFIHSWVNYLSPSYMATDMIFEMEKPQNVVMIEIDKHSHVWLPDFLLLFHSVFEVVRESEWVSELVS